MIAPSSYPVFGAEAIVNIKLLKAMTDSSYFEIDLISKRSKWADYPSDSLKDLGVKVNSIHIEEVDNSHSFNTLWLHFKSLLIFGSVFKGSHWAVKVLPRIYSLVSKNKYDYILTKNAPSLLLGFYVKKKFGVKWIATWNDPYPVIKYPAPYGNGCDAELNLLDKLQLNIMRYADMHIFPNVRLRDFMLKYLGIPVTKTIIIPHVVNGNHDPRILHKERRPKLRLIHSGNILPPRSPQNLVKSINQLEDDILNDIRITILGVKQPTDFIDSTIKSEVFEFLPPVTYSKSIKILNEFDVAIIVEAPCEEGIFLPTKVSDFMQSGIPIWAISPKKGVLNDLYNNGHIPYFSDITDVESIKRTLLNIYKDFKSNSIGKNNIPMEYTENVIVGQYLSL